MSLQSIPNELKVHIMYEVASIDDHTAIKSLYALIRTSSEWADIFTRFKQSLLQTVINITFGGRKMFELFYIASESEEFLNSVLDSCKVFTCAQELATAFESYCFSPYQTAKLNEFKEIPVSLGRLMRADELQGRIHQIARYSENLWGFQKLNLQEIVFRIIGPCWYNDII